MNDEGGTLSDLWRVERDACMLEGEGYLGSVFNLLQTGAGVDAVTVRSSITGGRRKAVFAVTRTIGEKFTGDAV